MKIGVLSILMIFYCRSSGKIYIYVRVCVCINIYIVFHKWCTKYYGMYCPVCRMVHIKEPMLLINKSSLCGGSGFPFSLSEWSLTICLMPYNRR